MPICRRCNTDFTDGVTCSACGSCFDFPCSGITEAGFRKLGDRKAAWRCATCKSAGLSSLSSPNKQASDLTLDSLMKEIKQISIKLAPLATLMDDMKTVKADLADLKESIELAHSFVKDFDDRVMGIETRLTAVEEASNKINLLQTSLYKLEADFQDHEQWTRMNNVEIKGIPQKNDENLFNILQRLATKANLEFDINQINFITRVPSYDKNATKSIIVSFHNRYKKEDFVAATRKLKLNKLSDFGFDGKGNIYINDHLTPHNKKLLTKARSIAREKNFQYIWVRNCKIMARKNNDSKIIAIRSQMDLVKIQ